MYDEATTIQGIRVPLSAIRYHEPGPVHRLDRRPWLTPREKVLLWALAFVIVLAIA
jgi:hypothetical protein